MPKVHPNATASEEEGRRQEARVAEEALTVWKKSLLFNCNGFAVFDGKGNLVFRVDNYRTGNRRRILLMDGSGKPLLTIRRKKLSLGDHWLIFNGEETNHPRFSVKKRVNFFKNSKTLARVTPVCSPKHVIYSIEGSYAQQNCVVLDDNKCQMAEIRRKEAVGGVTLGLDVFRLIVQPHLDMPFAMSLVIILEQMFGGEPLRFI